MGVLKIKPDSKLLEESRCALLKILRNKTLGVICQAFGHWEAEPLLLSDIVCRLSHPLPTTTTVPNSQRNALRSFKNLPYICYEAVVGWRCILAWCVIINRKINLYQPLSH